MLGGIIIKVDCFLVDIMKISVSVQCNVLSKSVMIECNLYYMQSES